jgi:hypothetical protein
MSFFDGYEEEALKGLIETLTKLSDGTLDEGDLVILRGLAEFALDKAEAFLKKEIGDVESKGGEVLNEYLSRWYVQLLLTLLVEELEDRIEE